MRHLMNPLDFSVEELDKLFALADDIEKDPTKYAHKCDGKILATCFYEPSTRTRSSFSIGVAELGGYPLVIDKSGSQLGRGEPVADTARVLTRTASSGAPSDRNASRRWPNMRPSPSSTR